MGLSWGGFRPKKFFFMTFVVEKGMKGRIAAGYEVHLLIVLWDPSGFAASIN